MDRLSPTSATGAGAGTAGAPPALPARAPRRRHPAATAPPGSRLALLVVVGLVLVGTTLTGSLATWSAEVTARADAALLGGVTLGVLAPLVVAAWLASGHHPAVPVAAMVLAGVAYTCVWFVPLDGTSALAGVRDATALAVVLAGLLTAVVTTGLAAHRRSVCPVLAGRAPNPEHRGSHRVDAATPPVGGVPLRSGTARP